LMKFGWSSFPWVVLVSAGLSILFLLLINRYDKVENHMATNANLMLTMLLGGFWHGANWNFVIWGGLNGLALVVFRYWKKISPWEGNNNWYAVAWTTWLTFSFISFTRVFFRSPDLATVDHILARITGDFGWQYIPAVVDNYANVFYVIYAGLVVHWIPDRMKAQILDSFVRTHVAIKIALVTLVVFLVYQAMSSDLQPFIYFQF